MIKFVEKNLSGKIRKNYESWVIIFVKNKTWVVKFIKY